MSVMRHVFFVILFLLLSNHALANVASVQASGFVQGFNDVFGECRGHFFDGQAPMLTGTRGQNLNRDLDALCFEGFAVLHSGVSRTPLWSAERLTRERIQNARTLARTDSFRSESRLPHGRRAELADYNRSGFDRGHLSPNGDMANANTQYESFSLANIAPQNGTHNRNVWRHIETTTRNLTTKYGDVYVVTGVVFATNKVERIGGRVLVPSHFFKAVYLPSLNQAAVYYSPNAERPSYEVISLSELTRRTGMIVFPALPIPVQDYAYDLPRPNEKGEIAPTGIDMNKIDLTTGSGWLLLGLEIFKYFISSINQA